MTANPVRELFGCRLKYLAYVAGCSEAEILESALHREVERLKKTHVNTESEKEFFRVYESIDIEAMQGG